MEKKIKTLGSLSAKHFSAHLDEVKLDTDRITHRIKIDHPPAAAIVPFVDPDHILMVRHWRYAVRRETLEIPAGKTDPGENTETCAHRELKEETGYSASRLIPIFSYFPAVGYSNETVHIYAAGGLVRTEESFDQEEIIGIEKVGLDRFFDLIENGTIRDGKTVIGVCLFQARQKGGEIGDDFFKVQAPGP